MMMMMMMMMMMTTAVATVMTVMMVMFYSYAAGLRQLTTMHRTVYGRANTARTAKVPRNDGWKTPQQRVQPATTGVSGLVFNIDPNQCIT